MSITLLQHLLEMTMGRIFDYFFTIYICIHLSYPVPIPYVFDNLVFLPYPIPDKYLKYPKIIDIK